MKLKNNLGSLDIPNIQGVFYQLIEGIYQIISGFTSQTGGFLCHLQIKKKQTTFSEERDTALLKI